MSPQKTSGAWRALAALAITGASVVQANAADPDADGATAVLMKDVMSNGMKALDRQPVDWGREFELIRAFAVHYPQSEVTSVAARNLMYVYAMEHTPAELSVAWRLFADSPSQSLSSLAKEEVIWFDRLDHPIGLTFKALDGRSVDLTALRGKVVLLDFWATWCGPCMAEMPNVKKTYASYHDKGFEIIGVSCDVAPDQAKDPSWARAAKTGQQVLEFTRRNNMPWPQNYEGKKHAEGGNAIAARFLVTGIPASYLIDKTGRVVAMNLRGPSLPHAVEKQLATP